MGYGILKRRLHQKASIGLGMLRAVLSFNESYYREDDVGIVVVGTIQEACETVKSQ